MACVIFGVHVTCSPEVHLKPSKSVTLIGKGRACGYKFLSSDLLFPIQFHECKSFEVRATERLGSFLGDINATKAIKCIVDIHFSDILLKLNMIMCSFVSELVMILFYNMFFIRCSKYAICTIATLILQSSNWIECKEDNKISYKSCIR